MDINIKIDAPELAAAISALAYAIDEFNRKTASASAVPVVEAAAETVQAEPEPPKEEKPAETKPAITFEQVRARLAPISQAGKQAQIKELFTQFGVNKLSDVPPEKYGELLAAAEGL